jgi:glycolate oxidase
VSAASKIVMETGRRSGGKYIGDEISWGDWAARHDRYANPLHGRLPSGDVVPMSWHCEDAAIPFSEVAAVREEWHAAARRAQEGNAIFDDWGIFGYTNGAHKPWGDVLLEIDIGIWEERLDEPGWQAYVRLKREIAEASIRHGGSITACHGSTREGDAELVPAEMGSAWPVMKQIKRLLDPHNIMNPGKQMLDEAYTDTPEETR